MWILRVCSSAIRCATPLCLGVTFDRSSTIDLLLPRKSAKQSIDSSSWPSHSVIGHSGVSAYAI